jgi:hypothetical protein
MRRNCALFGGNLGICDMRIYHKNLRICDLRTFKKSFLARLCFQARSIWYVNINVKKDNEEITRILFALLWTFGRFFPPL